MGMDLLRSCYKTEMRFFRDDPLAIKVRWFWCDEEAEVFPFWNRFASGNWAGDKFNWDGPGEILGSPRIWDPGAPVEGLIGDHFCGPPVSYVEGDIYPGRPLNALPDGRCACCTPLPPSCAETTAPLPDTLRLRILDIQLDPPSAPPSNFFIGDEIDLVRAFPGESIWVLSPAPTRDACPFTASFTLACIDQGEGAVLSLTNVSYPIHVPAALITEAPFRAYFNFFPIAHSACLALGDGQETWDCVVYDPADPPP